MVFHGTLRYNLDPFDEHTDQEMLSALVDVEDKDAISRGLGKTFKILTLFADCCLLQSLPRQSDDGRRAECERRAAADDLLGARYTEEQQDPGYG